MATKILVRRGLKADLTETTLDEGELGFTTDLTTDSHELGFYIGSDQIQDGYIKVNSTKNIEYEGNALTSVADTNNLEEAVQNIDVGLKTEQDNVDTLQSDLGTLDGEVTTLTTNFNNHTHGTINNNGTLTAASVTPATGDEIVIVDADDDNLKKAISIDTTVTDKFLRQDGTWATVDLSSTNTKEVASFVLNQAAPNYQLDLTLQDDTVLTADLSGLRNSDINSLTFNTSNDGVLTIGTVGGSTYTADLDGRYVTGQHTHGFITNDGKISGTSGTSVDIDIEDGDQLLIINSGSGNITTADVTFDTAETNKYLSQAGEFTTPTIDTSGLAASTHSHGDLDSAGKIGTSNNGFALGTGDHLVFADHSDTNLMKTTSITFDTTQSTKYLSQDGTFSVPSFTPGNYVETTIDTLDSSNTTELVSSFSSYDKVIAVLYPNFTGAANTTTNGDTVPIYVSDQLNFVQTNAGSVCLDGNGDPILGPTTEQQCTTAGGTWTPQYINNYGRVNFEPGGSIERINSTQVRFNLPTAITGVEWKLKLIGVTF